MHPDSAHDIDSVDHFEPAFACSERSLTLDTRHARVTLRHLGHRIARNPLDLFAHTQRVLLAGATQEREQLFSAMLDLAAALNGKGIALRSTLLERCGDELTEVQREAVFAALDPGHATVATSAPFRILDDRAAGEFVRSKTPHGSSAPSPAGPVAEALEYIESGQIEAAQALLEDALLRGIDDLAASSLLLDIYRRSRNAAGFRRMKSSLPNISAEARLMWDTADESFAG